MLRGTYILCPVGPAGHIVHSSASRARIVEAQFFILGWDRYGFHKKCAGTCSIELMFLPPVRSASHIVQSGASEAQNADALFIKLGWDRYGFHKMRIGTRYAEL
jgi:hypothetical protein